METTNGMVSGPLHMVVLGSTGSVGRQALDVARKNPGLVRVVALAAHRNVELLVAQAVEFGVKVLGVGDEGMKGSPALAQLPAGTTVSFGAAAIEALCVLEGIDVVLNALVGAAGLRASHATLARGYRLALANKESLVVGGDLLMRLVETRRETGRGAAYTGAREAEREATHAAVDTAAHTPLLLPVDSEHSAIFQCLVGEDDADVSRIWLTASGGPFRGRSRAQLENVTAAEALAHPTWHMGPKISIDSATMMNKGLEVIEAHHLFAIGYDNIRVVVHPQSMIHSMVEYRDGSVKAHLGPSDMRIPIQYALSYPQRWDAPLAPLDFTATGPLSFEAPDTEAFGALRLALEAGRAGGTAPAVLNAANEIAVQAFLDGACGFLDIERIIETVLEQHSPEPVVSLEQLGEVDARTRTQARALISSAS
ncbi:MAG: 1-deoxy-D-xylulose-5-phosphate reductoisomerase [Coriobacteriales bacterium]|nr:1-deoxy-D-xylulose-5-phosphate reductoisomerase [Coriobacteriales bacterium]